MDEEIIRIESKAFYLMITKLVTFIKEQENIKEDKWITTDQAMKKLHITSKSTLQLLRDNGSISYTTPLNKKIILYDSESINEHLERNKKNKF